MTSTAGPAGVDAEPAEQRPAGLSEDERSSGRRTDEAREVGSPRNATAEQYAEAGLDLDREPWVELRIHGVSGTPPESILLSGYVRQVAGDDKARFFVPADSMGRPQQDVPNRTLEAFHWGRFTSGSWTQAFWLLILPLGMINAAAFTLPETVPGRRSASHPIALGCLRVIGLGMTCLLVFSSVVGGMNLLAWQLGAAWDGTSARFWLVGSMALPIAALALFSWIGKRDTAPQRPDEDVIGVRATQPHSLRGAAASEGESAAAAGTEPPRPVKNAARAPRRSTDAGQAPSRFTDADFFAGDPDVPALRRLHQAAAASMVGAIAAWPVVVAGGTLARIVALTGLATIVVTLVVVLALGDPREPKSGWHDFCARLSRMLLVISGAVVIAAGMAIAFWTGPLAGYTRDMGGVLGNQIARAAEMPGIAAGGMSLLVVVMMALLVLLIAVAVAARADRARRAQETTPERAGSIRAFAPFTGGMTTWLMAAVGSFIGVGFAAAFDFAIQAVTNMFLRGESKITIPEVQQRAGYAWGLTVIAIVLLGGWVALGKGRRQAAFENAADVAFDLASTTLHDPRGLPGAWTRKVGSAMYLARLKAGLPWAFTFFAVFGTLMSLIAGVEQSTWVDSTVLQDSAWWWIPGALSALNQDGYGVITWLGAYFLALLSVMLLVLGRGAIRAERARRGLNVVWDVISFWPRMVHPFVPPPYSQHVVAALRRRISWHLGTLGDQSAADPSPPARSVVVAAHSQGSLITLAALIWLSAEERSRVGVVTFGSQIQQQFAKAFPQAVNLNLVEWVWKSFGYRWRNLYRDTDPIAGPALSWAHRSVQDPEHPASEHLLTHGEATGRQPDPIDPVTGRRVCGPEWRLLDPPLADRAMMGGPVAHLSGHSDYPADPDWPRAVTEVLP